VKEEKEPFFFPPHKCTVPQYTVSVIFHFFLLWHPTFCEGIVAEFTKQTAELCDLLGYDTALEEQNR